MLIEWINSLRLYLLKANRIIKLDINGCSFSKRRIAAYHIVFLLAACILVFALSKGISKTFIDYIKDILAIFVGFFVTVLTFVFDKLDVERIPTQQEMDNLPIENRWSSLKILKAKREHNYTVRFFYAIGLIIIYSTVVLVLLIPNILWEDFFNIDWHTYKLLDSIRLMTIDSLVVTLHVMLCLLYRFIVFLLIMKVFYFTLYSVSSLLQVLISKKNIDI